MRYVGSNENLRVNGGFSLGTIKQMNVMLEHGCYNITANKSISTAKSLLEVIGMEFKFKIGDVAPDFTLPSTFGDINLCEYRGKKNVLLAFYPMDFTPTCIKELTLFKEEYSRIAGWETEVLGISVDHIHAHRVFAASLGTLPYPLVSDWFRELVHQYGIFNEKSHTAKRCVVVIDKDGIIRYIGEFTPRESQQVAELFELLQNLSLIHVE